MSNLITNPELFVETYLKNNYQHIFYNQARV